MVAESTELINFANDLGYGAIKAELNNEKVLMPSVIARLSAQNTPKPRIFKNDDATKNYLKHFLDNLDVTVSSSAVSEQGRFLIGQAAVNSHLPLQSFDVNDFAGKSEDDLAVILTLSLIAGKAVKDAYEQGNDLTDTLKVNVNMATALPIAEGKGNQTLDKYREKYTNSTHTVTFHNFKDPITVSIKFKNVYVALEGETAQLTIRNASNQLATMLFNDLEKHYPELADSVTKDDITQAQNVLGIDIGEGTTDLVTILNGKVVSAASSSMPKGYGNVLQSAVEVLQSQQMNFDNRAQLKDYLNQKVSPFAKKHQEKVREVVYQQLEPFADQIIDAVSQTIRNAGSAVDLIFVYGGGAIPMESQSQLRVKIQKKLRRFNGGDDVPVIWLNPKYAQQLNEMGLKLILEAIK